MYSRDVLPLGVNDVRKSMICNIIILQYNIYETNIIQFIFEKNNYNTI